MFYAKSTGGFYDPAISTDIPADAVEITAIVHSALLEAQATGKQISHDVNGFPVAINMPKPVRTKEGLLAEVAEKRWQVETRGISITGRPIATDRESHAQLTSVYTSLKSGLIPNTPWKAADGSFTLVTLAEIEVAAEAVAAHVRACFAAELAHAEDINALDSQAALDAYDINANWPPTT